MIDIESFNQRSPYKVTPSCVSGFYEFTTDYDVQYQIGFMPDASIIQENAYQFVITNVNNRISPNDSKVKDTVITMIDEFFRKNNDTLLYICETGDGKQAMRNRLFHYWFSQYENSVNLVCLSSSVTDEEGVVNYATIIIRNDNPKLSEIISEYTETIKLSSSKPE